MTLRVDCDDTKWFYVPLAWPWGSFATAEQWRDAVVEECSERFGYAAPMREWLGESLDGVMRSVGPGEYRFAYLGDPERFVSFLSLYEFPTLEASDETLLGFESVDLVRAPTVTEFAGGGLGLGAKSLRFVAAGEGRRGITCVAHWVWRLADRDVAVIAADQDIPEFMRLQDDLDEFARGISLEDLEFHLSNEE